MFNNDIKKNSASGLNNYSCILLLSKLLEKTNMNENKKITIIIDEPEKFCHPNLLNKLIENLIVISQKVNLYISSHSPYLISKIYSTNNKPELLFFHEKYSNKPTENIKRIDKNVFEDVNNNVFRSVLVKNEIYRREFIYNLFANKIIIVEDNSTKIFVQYLLEKNNIHDNINIYVCHGKSWMNKTYNYLIDKFFINKEKIYCIYDEDSNKQPHEQHNENHNKIPENKK
jgi:predicted ATP-dependent endonuclease of OLD family